PSRRCHTSSERTRCQAERSPRASRKSIVVSALRPARPTPGRTDAGERNTSRKCPPSGCGRSCRRATSAWARAFMRKAIVATTAGLPPWPMPETSLVTDYLVVGAGAAGLAFTDALIAEDPDVHVTVVDRFGKAGGHWYHAYP